MQDRGGTDRARTVRKAERNAQPPELARLTAELRRLRAENARLRRRAVTDPLTGVGNRAALRARLDEVVTAAREAGTDTSLLMIDLDHFKALNDRLGHPAGDRVLRQVARLLRAVLRAADFLARFGGEEFTVVLPATGGTTARKIGARLRSAVARGPWTDTGVTVSIGAATLGADAVSAGRLIRSADRALFRAKAAGRNRVCE
jgi:diguanylate cyclase (GGDEF)-like protein